MKTEKQVLQETVGKYCKSYRENILKMDLKTFSEIAEMPYKTLYSFESGLSSNLYIYYLYYINSDDKLGFIDNLMNELKGVNNGFSSN